MLALAPAAHAQERVEWIGAVAVAPPAVPAAHVRVIAPGETSFRALRELGLSPRSVEDVRARLLRKFAVRNSAELLARLTGLDG